MGCCWMAARLFCVNYLFFLSVAGNRGEGDKKVSYLGGEEKGNGRRKSPPPPPPPAKPGGVT